MALKIYMQNDFADYNGFRGACEYALTITENRRVLYGSSVVFEGMLF